MGGKFKTVYGLVEKSYCVMKQYIVGIDFGDGETTASYADVASGNVEYVLIRRSTDIELNKIPSIVMKGNDGQYAISLPDGQLVLSFKTKVSPNLSQDDPNAEKQLAFEAFIRDVVGHIKANHSGDIFMDENEVILYIAAPTKWSEEDKANYRAFVENAVGCKVGWVINESDAAYFSKRSSVAPDSVALIIDYGSSTIDFTLMSKGRKLDIDLLSTDFGANRIEDIILADMQEGEKAGKYESMKSLADEALKRSGKEGMDISPYLKLSIRKAKEKAYTFFSAHRNKYSDMYIEGDWKLFDDVPNADPNKEIVFEYEFKESGLNDYKNSVTAHFSMVKGQVEDKYGQKIDTVILSGGGAMMLWVEDAVRNVWGEEVKIITDEHPSYVVATGIVEYALSEKKCKEHILGYLNTQDSLDLMSIYKECDNTATRESIKLLLPPILDKYINSSQLLTGNDLLLRLAVFFRDLTDNSDYKKCFSETFNKEMTVRIKPIISEAIKKFFAYDISMDDIVVPELPEVPIISFGEEIVDAISSWIEDSADVFFSFNWEKKRDRDKRKQLADGCLAAAESIDLTYTNEETMASELKQIAVDGAMRIFNEKKLFRTVGLTPSQS